LLFVSMEICLGCWDDDDPKIGSNLVSFRSFWSLYQCVMDSENPLTEAIVLEETNRRSFKLMLKGFLKHLLVCRNAALATELLETLSVLSLGGEANDSFTEMVRVTWTALHSTFPSVEPSFPNHVPFIFIEALKRRCPGVLASTRRTSRDVAVRETLLKAGFNKSKMMEKHFYLVDGMLRHWGFLVLAEEITPIAADHLHQLYSNLHTFLSEVNDMAVPRKSRVRLDNSSDDDADYVPPKPFRVTRPELPESSIPGLDSRNFFNYFQILLDMTVASAALFSVKVGSQWIDPLNGPFRELCKLVETFGFLVNLYRKRIHVFPQNILSSVLNTCRSMLNVLNFQSTQCIEWRSSQPALTTEQIEAEVFDPASLQFLGRVLDVFGVHVVGSLTSLCESIETLSSPPLEQNGSALFSSAQNQRVKALRLKIDKMSTLLDKFADVHKLPTPSKSIDTQEKGEPARKRRRIEIKGFLQFEESTGESEQSNMVALSMDAGKQEPTYDEGRTLSSELTWEEDESEDSFGVDGDWGRESEESS